MYEEDPEKKEQIGHWKKQPNYLTNYKGERFNFAEPAEVPDKMHALVNWLNAEKEKIQRGSKDASHPLFLAFKFHTEYVTIHPFYDGNGRTSRILSNIILISYGYPPMYVKTDERVAYYQYLADIQAYGGDPDLFYDFMAGLVIRSQELVLNAAGGGDIEDDDDLLKEISIWKNQLNVSEIEARSNARIVELYNLNLGPLIELYQQKMRTAFSELFSEWEEQAFVNNQNYNKEGKKYIDNKINQLIEIFPEEEDAGAKYLRTIEDVYKIDLQTFMNGFKGDKTNTFSMHNKISFEFLPFKYLIKINEKELPEKFYNENISLKEQTDIVNDSVKETFKKIKLNMKNPPLSELGPS